MCTVNCWRIYGIVVATIILTLAVGFRVFYNAPPEIRQIKIGLLSTNKWGITWGDKVDAMTAKSQCEKSASEIATPLSLEEEIIIMDSFMSNYPKAKDKAATMESHKNCDNLFYIGLRRRVYQNWESASRINSSLFPKNKSNEILFDFGFRADICNRLLLPQDIVNIPQITIDPLNDSKYNHVLYLSNDVNCYIDSLWQCILCQYKCDTKICYTIHKNTSIFSFNDAMAECKNNYDDGQLAIIPHLNVLDEIKDQVKKKSNCVSLGIGNRASQGLESLNGDKLNYGSEKLHYLTTHWYAMKDHRSSIFDNSTGDYFVMESTFYPECVVINVDANYTWELEHCDEPHCYYCYDTMNYTS